MSMDNARAFYEKVKADQGLQKKIGELAKENPQGIGAVILKTAKENGFEFTAEELNAFFAEEAKTNGSAGQLNDNELEVVAGGSFGPKPLTTGVNPMKCYIRVSVRESWCKNNLTD